MGTCCLGTKPQEKFIGRWTDNKSIELTIDSTGNINYTKQTEHSNAKFNGPTRFKGDKFLFCCCCCCLHGSYVEDDDSNATILVNGTVLRRQE